MHEIPHLVSAYPQADGPASPGSLAAILFVITLLVAATGAAFWIGAALSNPANQTATYQVADETFP